MHPYYPQEPPLPQSGCTPPAQSKFPLYLHLHLKASPVRAGGDTLSPSGRWVVMADSHSSPVPDGWSEGRRGVPKDTLLPALRIP
mmetsp:Transcript_86608/g.150782  ORF Transcript_86608/g.150782 Transcript_86608/m.150782 type:complete len:85 (-) Transcript_86608:872-1126(-)